MRPDSANVESYPNAGPLINRITLPNSGYITNTFDSLARLTGTFLENSAHGTLNSHAYVLNNAHQRTQMTRADGSYVDYGYDGIGQLKSAVGKEPGGSARLHEKFGYAYDAAGNLFQRTNHLLVQTFNHNALNEIATVSRANTLTVARTTTSPATSVSVHGLAAALYGDNTFARDGWSLVDGENTFTAIAQDSYGRADTNTVIVNLPVSASFEYDSAGNLLNDSLLTYAYNPDGTLRSIQRPNVWGVQLAYDGLRRITRVDNPNDAGANRTCRQMGYRGWEVTAHRGRPARSNPPSARPRRSTGRWNRWPGRPTPSSEGTRL